MHIEWWAERRIAVMHLLKTLLHKHKNFKCHLTQKWQVDLSVSKEIRLAWHHQSAVRYLGIIFQSSSRSFRVFLSNLSLNDPQVVGRHIFGAMPIGRYRWQEYIFFFTDSDILQSIYWKIIWIFSSQSLMEWNSANICCRVCLFLHCQSLIWKKRMIVEKVIGQKEI